MLSDLDPTPWGLGLSPENAQICWDEAVQSLKKTVLPAHFSGPRPSRVLVVASANVFTATLPWMAIFSALGIRVRIKAARTLGTALGAIAAEFPGVEVVDQRRDLPIAGLLAGCDAALVFGTQGAIEAFMGHGVPILGFGPRYGAVYTENLAQDATAIAQDLARYDTRGCMSPVACFVRQDALEIGLEAMVEAVREAQRGWPRGQVSVEEAHGLRTRSALARAVGRVQEGEGWQVVVVPKRFFSPSPLPRSLVVHPVLEQGEALAWMAGVPTLGTFATHLPVSLPLIRVCAPGEMQRPPVSPTHDGIAVLEWLAGRGV